MEYLWPAGSFIEPSGDAYTVEGGGGLLSMVPVRINANGKALTVEELHTKKKDMHLAEFRYLLDETARDIMRFAEERAEEEGRRLEWLLPGMDGTRVTFSAAELVAQIVAQAEAVLARHAEFEPEWYNKDEDFRHTVDEMLETRAAVVATLRFYLANPGAGTLRIQDTFRILETGWGQ